MIDEALDQELDLLPPQCEELNSGWVDEFKQSNIDKSIDLLLT